MSDSKNIAKIKSLVVNALEDLKKTSGNQGNYPYIHVSFSEHDRMYIYMCPVMKEKYVVHEVRVTDPSFSFTRHFTHESLKGYIMWGFKEIKYAAVTEPSTDFDTMKVLYEDDS